MIDENEYATHKRKCGESFETIFDQLNKMERAMFGEPELKRKGVLDMTSEMYESVMATKGLWTFVKVIVALGSVIAALKLIQEYIRR